MSTDESVSLRANYRVVAHVLRMFVAELQKEGIEYIKTADMAAAIAHLDAPAS